MEDGWGTWASCKKWVATCIWDSLCLDDHCIRNQKVSQWRDTQRFHILLLDIFHHKPNSLHIYHSSAPAPPQTPTATLMSIPMHPCSLICRHRNPFDSVLDNSQTNDNIYCICILWRYIYICTHTHTNVSPFHVKLTYQIRKNPKYLSQADRDFDFFPNWLMYFVSTHAR